MPEMVLKLETWWYKVDEICFCAFCKTKAGGKYDGKDRFLEKDRYVETYKHRRNWQKNGTLHVGFRLVTNNYVTPLYLLS